MGRAGSVVSLMAAVLVVASAATAQTYKTLAHFSGEEGEPSAGLTRASDGSYYGTTRSGGKYGLGSVYRITPRGDTVAFTTVHAFREADGATLSGDLVQAGDGYFYGTASTGGPSGSGTVFRMSRNGDVRVLHAFDRDTTGELPLAGLIEGSGGCLYGTTMRGGAGNSGTVFRMDTAGAITVLHAFDYWSTGASSAAPLVEGHDGRLYGTTMAGGTFGQGVLFSIDTGGNLTVLHSFDERTTGSIPERGVIQGRDGNLYGTTFNGGAFGEGTLFRATTAGQVTVLRSFDPSWEGSHPSARLTQGRDGALYGTTTWGASGGAGTAFRADTSGGLTILHAFEVNATGRYPAGALLEVGNGVFYGTAARGGPYGPGTIFRINHPGGAQLLHGFMPGPGTLPLGGLMQASDGHFYGTTRQRGGWDAGALFRLTAGGSLRRLYSFDGAAGYLPSAALLESDDGWLYGTAEGGGANGAGSVFRTTRQGQIELMHSFARVDGEDPQSALVRGSDGYFYGTTCWGGSRSGGTVYRMDDRASVTVVGAFDYENGACPSAAVVEEDDGAFYGTTYLGGPGGNGTIFRMERSGQITVVHAFSSATGLWPLAPLVKGADGFLYGTAYGGGAHGFGTVFRLEPPGTLHVLHSFDGGTTGGYPAGPLLLGSDGFLYGTTSAGFWGTTDSGSASGLGTIFRVDGHGKIATLHAFVGADGANPVAPLIEARDGRLYSTTALGGRYDAGVAFRLSIIGVSILTPNGGESFHPGKSTTIRWIATGTPTAFQVELSRDGGDTFAPIRECTGLEGSARSCTWKPKGPLTGEAVIRITASDGNGDAASDESDSRFAIRPHPIGR
jgi:uncharacterized repeat protein (TIGR03803 family)